MGLMISITPLYKDGQKFAGSDDGKISIPSTSVVNATAMPNGVGGNHPGVNTLLLTQEYYKSNQVTQYEISETLNDLHGTASTITSTQGPVGPVGQTGGVGPIGPSGPAGTNGAQGPAGPSGTNGAQGMSGPVGPQGLQGSPGAPGPIGPLGLQGIVGPAGPQGNAGNNGLQGIQGLLGPQGNVGAVGAAGPAGPVGSSGPAGHGLNNRGNWTTGTIYSTGDYVFSTASAAGATTNSLWVSTFTTTYTSTIIPKTDTANWSELPGLPGPQGPAGPQGTAGAVGTTGAQGSVGAQGSIGVTGPAGSAGPAGPAGGVGPIGPAGNTGPAGPQGSTGAQGPQGNAGVQGAQGPAGSTGPQGPSVYIDTLQSVMTRGNTSTKPMFFAGGGTTSDAYGFVSVTMPADSNPYAYYSMTRAGQVAWNMGIQSNNMFYIGTGGQDGTNGLNPSTIGLMSIDTAGNVTISGNLTVNGNVQSPRFYT